MISRPVILSRALLILLLTGVLSPLPPEAIAQDEASYSVTGVVKDPSGAAVPGARVTASQNTGNVSRTAKTDAAGRFSFPEMPPGSCMLHVDAPGFKVADVAVETGLDNSGAVTITLALQSLQEVMTVEGTNNQVDAAATAHTDISPSLTNALPDSAVNGGFSRVLTLGTPGVAAESNGGFHPLGEHAEVSFNVDGQPISDQQSRGFSNQVSLNTIESVDVINGAPPAEFGDKTSMIVRALTKSGLGAGSPSGRVSFGYGAFDTGTADASLRAGNSKVGNFFAADFVNSRRFLDPPETVALHAAGNAENLFDRLDVQPTPVDSLHFNLSLSRSWFQTPNTYDQQISRQDQRQITESRNLALAYTHRMPP